MNGAEPGNRQETSEAGAPVAVDQGGTQRPAPAAADQDGESNVALRPTQSGERPVPPSPEPDATEDPAAEDRLPPEEVRDRRFRDELARRGYLLNASTGEPFKVPDDLLDVYADRFPQLPLPRSTTPAP